MDERITQYRDAVYEQVVKVGKSLGNVTRLQLLNLLAQGPKTVEVLASTANLSVATTSRNLQILKQANLVGIERDKNFITYRVNSERVKQLMTMLVDICEEVLPEMTTLQKTLTAETGSPKALTIEDLRGKLMSEDVCLIDLRPADEFASRHLPGARNVPYDQLERRQSELPKDKEIVVYCRGRLCAYANVASQQLHDAGFNVATFNQTVWEWSAISSATR
ncbi:ArsR/SmtB family transcription factor [Latilactobacillus graminis]|uniref:Bacterial regulatory, arsR family protein n=2 Tax=Latilactobacillus graminis TaxID=60519 RepID=A0AA89I1J2_9LACO|nr:metalloregulator ArsR/SmtB family transcription factor [Latilactobacillus graminis]KRM23640.1 bacterial regulatory, arsR family protein [Latilactobacillus graminis DSM 20719]QFP80170.1 metalloregulator ArsR/SmtB family transcription factor [Latilactobacillus graminis]